MTAEVALEHLRALLRILDRIALGATLWEEERKAVDAARTFANNTDALS